MPGAESKSSKHCASPLFTRGLSLFLPLTLLPTEQQQERERKKNMTGAQWQGINSHHNKFYSLLDMLIYKLKL